MANKKLPSKKKAKEILHDKTAHGHPLTDQQRKFFGWLANRADGGVNPIEGNLYSKLTLLRNKDRKFVDRALNPSQYPVQYNPDMTSSTHLMGWGEDNQGQAYMYPEIFNSSNEAIKVPNQYANYISSVGYKQAANQIADEMGTGTINKKKPFKHGGMLPMFPNGGQNPPIILSDIDEYNRRSRAYQDSLLLYNSTEGDIYRLNHVPNYATWEDYTRNWDSSGAVTRAFERLRALNNRYPSPVGVSSRNFGTNRGEANEYQRPVQPYQFYADNNGDGLRTSKPRKKQIPIDDVPIRGFNEKSSTYAPQAIPFTNEKIPMSKPDWFSRPRQSQEQGSTSFPDRVVPKTDYFDKETGKLIPMKKKNGGKIKIKKNGGYTSSPEGGIANTQTSLEPLFRNGGIIIAADGTMINIPQQNNMWNGSGNIYNVPPAYEQAPPITNVQMPQHQVAQNQQLTPEAPQYIPYSPQLNMDSSPNFFQQMGQQFANSYSNGSNLKNITNSAMGDLGKYQQRMAQMFASGNWQQALTQIPGVVVNAGKAGAAAASTLMSNRELKEDEYYKKYNKRTGTARFQTSNNYYNTGQPYGENRNPAYYAEGGQLPQYFGGGGFNFGSLFGGASGGGGAGGGIGSMIMGMIPQLMGGMNQQQQQQPPSIDPNTAMQFMSMFKKADGGEVDDYQVHREGANVEAEGGEVAQLPNGLAGTINGASHDNGGVTMNLPEDSRIFSEKLETINSKGKKQSFAKIAKKYNTEKDMATADNYNATNVAKKTAALNIKLKNQKLDELFEKQEMEKLSGKHGGKIMKNTMEEYGMMKNGGKINYMASVPLPFMQPGGETTIPLYTPEIEQAIKQGKILDTRRGKFADTNSIPKIQHADPNKKGYFNADLSTDDWKDFYENWYPFFKSKGISQDQFLKNPTDVLQEQKFASNVNQLFTGSPYYSGITKIGDDKAGARTAFQPLSYIDVPGNNVGHQFRPYDFLQSDMSREEYAKKHGIDPNSFSADYPGVVYRVVADKNDNKQVVPATENNGINVPKANPKDVTGANKQIYQEGLSPWQTAGEMMDLFQRKEPVLYIEDQGAKDALSNYAKGKYLNIQPQLNANTRGFNAVRNFLDSSPVGMANLQQAAANKYMGDSQAYGTKYNYDANVDRADNQAISNLLVQRGASRAGALDSFEKKIANRNWQDYVLKRNALASIGEKQLQNKLENKNSALIQDMFNNYGYNGLTTQFDPSTGRTFIIPNTNPSSEDDVTEKGKYKVSKKVVTKNPVTGQSQTNYEYEPIQKYGGKVKIPKKPKKMLKLKK